MSTALSNDRKPASSRPARARSIAGSPDAVTAARLAHALEALAKKGQLAGARTRRVSARVDPGLVEAARARTGIANDSDLINAALALIAAPDDFGPWLVAQAGCLSAEFELGL